PRVSTVGLRLVIYLFISFAVLYPSSAVSLRGLRPSPLRVLLPESPVKDPDGVLDVFCWARRSEDLEPR
ncbi:hypothetical protein FKM82_022942, partial [Ascaphus truei]